MIKVRRDYGNGFEVEVEGDQMTKVLTDLAQADELFYDIRAWGKDETGKNISSDRVKFTVRHAKTAQGKPCKYYEQVCVDGGPLKFFKRHIGEFQERVGEVYVKKGPPQDPSNHVLGLVGWSKYIGTGEQHGDQQYNQDTQYQQRQQPQQQRSQPTQQAAPQQQYNPHAAPPQQYQPSQSSMEDIPF
jgi:hypothetical protein